MATNVLLSVLLAATLAPQTPSAQAPAQPSVPASTSTSTPTQAVPPPPTPPRSVPESYVIGPKDVLSISVLEDDVMTGKYPVDETGKINLPYLGLVQAGGKTILQLQKDIAAALDPAYIKHPSVRADIDTYKSQQVFVSGSVRQPGKIQMTGQLKLTEALAQAGSMTADASDDIQVRHNTAPSDAASATDDDSVIHIKARDLVLGRNDIQLQDGDYIFVPPAKHFTITGQVKNSGSYVWEEGITVEQALARAGGVTDRGSTRGIKAHRMVGGKMTDVDLKMQDKILPDDVVQIGQRLF